MSNLDPRNRNSRIVDLAFARGAYFRKSKYDCAPCRSLFNNQCFFKVSESKLLANGFGKRLWAMRPCWGFEVPPAGKRKRERADDEDFTTLGLAPQKGLSSQAERKATTPSAQRFKVREKMFKFKYESNTPWIYENEEEPPWKLEDCPNQSEILKEARQILDYMQETREPEKASAAVKSPKRSESPNVEVAPFGATLHPRFRRHSKTIWLKPEERRNRNIRGLKTKAFATLNGSVSDVLTPPPEKPGVLKAAFWKLPHART